MAGPATTQTDRPLRVSLTSAFGFGYDGGHLETKTLSESGQVTRGPLHEHEVSLDFLQLELGLGYAFNESWLVQLRLPYSVKRQKAKIRFIEPASPAEMEDILRNRDAHHRSETYQGIGDPSLLLAHTLHNSVTSGDALTLSFGLGIPLGKTERDPFEAGDAGVEHLHILFGTGTFDPLFEFQYRVPFGDAISLRAFASSRVPVYRNAKGYHAPLESSASLRLVYETTTWLSSNAGYLFYRQGYGDWKETGRDVNSGLLVHAALLGLHLHQPDGPLGLSMEVRFPLSQRTLSGDGDTFEQRPTYLLGFSTAF